MPRPRARPAVARAGRRGRTRLPAGRARRRLEHRHRARIAEVAEPEAQRIGAGRRRQLVHEGLVGEGVLRRAEPAQRRHPQRRPIQGVHDHAVGAEGIAVLGIALAPDGARRRLGHAHLLAREQIARAAAGPARVGGRPHRVVPGGDASPRVQRAAHTHEHGGSLGLVAVLVGAHPLHAHRPAHRAREHRGVGGRVVGAVVAVAAGGFHEDHPDALGRQAEQPGQGAPQLEDPLAPGPDRRLARAHVGDAAGRPDGGVQLEGPAVLGLERVRRPAEGALHVAAIDQHAGGGRRAAKRLVQRGRRRQPPPAAPGDHERARGGDGLLLALADDADEIALADDLDEPGHRPRRGVVHRGHARPHRLGPDHAAVQHARHPHVVHVVPARPGPCPGCPGAAPTSPPPDRPRGSWSGSHASPAG